MRVFCNTTIIIWSFLIPSFLTSSKSKRVESLAAAESKIISYGTFCAWTFYLIKKFFVCCCGDSSKISFLGENQSIQSYIAANEISIAD